MTYLLIAAITIGFIAIIYYIFRMDMRRESRERKAGRDYGEAVLKKAEIERVRNEAERSGWMARLDQDMREKCTQLDRVDRQRSTRDLSDNG